MHFFFLFFFDMFDEVTVGNHSGVKRYTLGTPNRKRISKAAARGHKKGVVDQCFADPKVKTYTVKNEVCKAH